MKIAVARLILGVFIAMLIASSTTGCRNTARGAGQDIENMGEKIQEKTR